MGDRFQLKGAPAATWISQNPILAAREPGVETDTNSIKIGDGVTAWTSLDYVNKNLPGEITNFTVDASAGDQSITLPDATVELFSRLYIISGDFDTTFSTTGGQTIDGEATLVVKGASTILFVPTNGDWRTFQGGGGGSATVFATVDETAGVAQFDLVYVNGVNTVGLADQSALATSVAMGMALEAAADTVEVEVQTSGLVEGLSGLTTGSVYYLGADGGYVVEGSLPTTGYKQRIGIALSTTEMLLSFGEVVSTTYNDNAPLGVISDFVGVTPPAGWEWIPITTTTKLRSMYQQFWENVLGSIDWFAPDATAAANATTAGTFHFPTIADQYIRGGFHANATFDNTDNSLTLLDQNGDAIEDTWRDGTAIRFIGGTMPTGITEYTIYYIGWNTDKWLIYDTAANGEINDGSTGLVAFTTDGSGVTGTQFGITLEDQMQKIEGGIPFNDGVTPVPLNGVFSHTTGDPVRAVNVSASAGTFTQVISFDSADSPNARTSATTDGETRGRTAYTRKIIKVSNLLPTGEPVTAVKYDTGWVANSDWTNAEFLVTHNLNIDTTSAIVKFFISPDGLESSAFEVSVGYETGANSGTTLYSIDSNSFKLQTGSAGTSYVSDSGVSAGITTQSWYYKIVVYKPTILSSVVDLMYPIGAQYTQYASAASNDAAVALPASKSPAALFGGVWTKLWDTESVYWRTEGTDADDGRVDGKQLDQFQGHLHEIIDGGNSSGSPYNKISCSTGALAVNAKTGVSITDGVNGTPRTGAETRVTGRLMRIWERTG